MGRRHHLRPTWEGFRFLAFIVDAWSRRRVGRSTRNDLRTELVIDARRYGSVGTAGTVSWSLGTRSRPRDSSSGTPQRSQEAGTRHTFARDLEDRRRYRRVPPARLDVGSEGDAPHGELRHEAARPLTTDRIDECNACAKRGNSKPARVG
jgi:hypothetical protein